MLGAGRGGAGRRWGITRRKEDTLPYVTHSIYEAGHRHIMTRCRTTGHGKKWDRGGKGAQKEEGKGTNILNT